MKDDLNTIASGLDNADNEHLDGYFKPGVTPEDIPELYPLLRSREALAAFISLFRGTEASVIVRLMVLRTIGGRGEDPQWSPRELAIMFQNLDEIKLDTTLKHLRKNGLLIWDSDISRYQVSPFGRMALAALASVLSFTGDDGGDIGYITSQIAAGQAMGVSSKEQLEHLLSRLAELEDEFDRAIVSGSETRIRDAEKHLNSVWSHVKIGTEVIGALAERIDLDRHAHRLAQKVGRLQSKLLNMTGRFQSELNLIERQKVHLGQSGLSSSDLLQWLRSRSQRDLAGYLADVATASVCPGFALTDIAADVAEEHLLRDIRPAVEDIIPPPPPQEKASIVEMEQIDLEALNLLKDDLAGIDDQAPMEQVVPARDFGTTSYRLSLIALIGKGGDVPEDSPVKALVDLPLDMIPDESGAIVKVGRHGVKEMTKGVLARKDRPS